MTMPKIEANKEIQTIIDGLQEVIKQRNDAIKKENNSLSETTEVNAEVINKANISKDNKAAIKKEVTLEATKLNPCHVISDEEKFATIIEKNSNNKLLTELQKLFITQKLADKRANFRNAVYSPKAPRE